MLARFEAISGLDAMARAQLVEAAEHSRTIAAHRDLIAEGAPVTETLLVLSGWAARVRYALDGRRQILSFILPGDMLGLCDHERPLMISTIVAITPLVVSRAPRHNISAPLDQCYRVSKAIDEANLLAHINRLGQLSAYERIVDLLLELYERLSLADLVRDGAYEMPLTQEVLADALGLTSVHINRMLQQARRNEKLVWRGGEIVLRDVEALQHEIGRRTVKVCAPK